MEAVVLGARWIEERLYCFDVIRRGFAPCDDSASGARQRALAECGTRGSGCTLCNCPVVVDEGLGLDHVARRQVQEGLQMSDGLGNSGIDIPITA